jgi:hypothetical protein
MNSSHYLKNWFNSMIIQFPEYSFRYKYSPQRRVHYIGVFPATVENDLDYCKEEIDVWEFLSKKFPEETFLFGEEGFNFRSLENPEIFENKATKENYQPTNHSYNLVLETN